MISLRKPWGHEEILYNKEYIVLRMVMRKGEETSLHKHLNRDEYFIIVKGKGRLLHENKVIPIKEGDMIHIKKGQLHRWMADEDLEIIEVTTPPLEDEFRINDKYNRRLGFIPIE